MFDLYNSYHLKSGLLILLKLLKHYLRCNIRLLSVLLSTDLAKVFKPN